MRRLHRKAHRHSNFRCGSTPVPRRHGERPPHGGGVRGRILVADDDPMNTELLSYFLKEHGYDVSTAPDGNQALEMGTSGDFRLVILDVHMPMYDGVEVLQLLRKRHRLHPIKVIALTGDLSDEVRQELESGGVDGFLTKPVDLDLLHSEVDRLMAD
ncbi:MAG: response regulator [Chloroflexi bacterium]|nr:MAG: response regulator [Chloroflexota bacterium]